MTFASARRIEPVLRNPTQFCGGSFEAQDPLFLWSDITPRIGVVYDVKGDGRWAVKFNFSRYAEQLGISYGSATNVNRSGREQWNWTDANGDGVFQYGEQTTFRSRSFPGLGTQVDPELTSPMNNGS